MVAKEKKIYIEYLRILAIILVIYNHTRSLGYDLYKVTEEASSYWLSVAMIPLCKIAVPIFFMISGVTLLSKEESIKEIFSKRILKYGIVILLFGTLQFFRYARSGKTAFTLSAWFMNLYSNPLLETYWFLYLYVGFLLLLPFQRKIAASLKKEEFFYLFCLNVICSLLAVIGHMTGYFINGNIFALTTIFFYPLMGYGMDKYCGKKNGIPFILLTVISWISIVFLSVIYIKTGKGTVDNLDVFLQLFTPLLACGIFGTIKTLCKTNVGKFSSLVTCIGGTAFGIYLIEDMIRNQLEKIVVKVEPNAFINDFVVGVVFTLATFAVGALIIIIAKRIPIIKKLF